MKTLHLGLRVADLDRSLAFYGALGYETVGSVPETPLGALTMMKLPDDDFVTLELVHNPGAPFAGGGSLSHFVIAVASLVDTVAGLAAHGIDAGEPVSPDGTADFLTTLVHDPDGNEIELVQWPAGHPVGMTSADFAT